MKFYFNVIFYLVVFFPIKSNCQTNGSITSFTNTFNGWRGLKWGTNEAIVKAKLSRELQELPYKEGTGVGGTLYCPFIILNYALGTDSFKVRLLFNNLNELEKVNIVKDNPSDISLLIQKLERSLIEKYGEPKIKQQVPKYYMKWSFPDLSVELSYSNMNLEGHEISQQVYIIYSKPDKSQLDKF